MVKERFYKDHNRLAAHRSQLEHKNYFTFEQVHDVLDLLAEGDWPDSSFSDDELNLWSLIRRKLNVKVR